MKVVSKREGTVRFTIKYNEKAIKRRILAESKMEEAYL